MRRTIYNLVSVIHSAFRFAALRLFHPGHCIYDGVQRFSPNMEVIISGKGTLRLGKRVRVHRHSKLVASGGILRIGTDTAIGNGVGIYCMEGITIGEGVQIAEGTKIYDHDHDFRAPGGMRAERFVTAPVEIGSNSWIGCNTVILRGTKLGENCVVGAGSVLKGEYPANSIIIQKRETEQRYYNCRQD